jgi:hypothetical protein
MIRLTQLPHMLLAKRSLETPVKNQDDIPLTEKCR